MKHGYFLKKPNLKKDTLILFQCYFNDEKKQFKYSTGEFIKPSEWNFEQGVPHTKGKARNSEATTILAQLMRYTSVFETTESLCIKMNESFTSQVLKNAFDNEFKKVYQKLDFFSVYDLYTSEKINQKAWKLSTIKRHKNIKNHLIEFEKKKKYKLTLSTINKKFYNEFLKYCYNDLKHYSNTVSRNVGLFKSFMLWAYNEKHTYNNEFQAFEKPKTVITEEVALTLEQVTEIFNLEIENKKYEKVRDVFVFQCLTGMRFGEMKAINENVISENAILLKEEKDATKEYREIPLFEITKYILKKYNYKLPLIANQKQNLYIKELLKTAEFNNETEFTKNTEFTRVQGVNVTKFVMPLHDRISTHTARRTFITIMKNKGIADKTIMSITGHRDLKTFNNYHKVTNDSTLNAVKKAFETMELPKLKKA